MVVKSIGLVVEVSSWHHDRIVLRNYLSEVVRFVPIITHAEFKKILKSRASHIQADMASLWSILDTTRHKYPVIIIEAAGSVPQLLTYNYVNS